MNISIYMNVYMYVVFLHVYVVDIFVHIIYVYLSYPLCYMCIYKSHIFSIYDYQQYIIQPMMICYALNLH